MTQGQPEPALSGSFGTGSGFTMRAGGDPYAREADTFPRLSVDEEERVASYGIVQDVASGTPLFEIGDRGVDFFLVLSGHVEIYEPGPDDGEAHVVTVHAEHQFTGELDLFNDRTILVGGRMGADGNVARLDRASFRRMLAGEPDVAEIIMRAFILRRAGFIAQGQAAVTVIGSPRDADTLRVQRFLARNGHPFIALDPSTDAAARQRLDEHGADEDQTPLVLWGARDVLLRPTTTALAQCLGIAEPLDSNRVSDVVVIATGARYRQLNNVKGLDRFEGSGVHYAATAIEAGLCENEEVVIVGGGNSAGQAAMFLSRYAKHVHILIRGGQLAASMSSYLSERIAASPDRITLHTYTQITAVNGARHLGHVTWTNHRTETSETRPVTGIFLMLGAAPNTDWLDGALALDDQGFICTGQQASTTPTHNHTTGVFEPSIPGVFAVGDTRSGSTKRVASGVGEGSVVISAVHQYLATTSTNVQER